MASQAFMKDIEFLTSSMQNMDITKELLSSVFACGAKAYKEKHFEAGSRDKTSLEEVQSMAAQFLVDGIDGMLDEQEMDRTTNPLIFPNGRLDEEDKSELIGILQSSQTSDDTEEAPQEPDNLSTSEALGLVFDSYGLPKPFVKKMLMGLDKTVVQAICLQVAEIIPSFFDEFVAVDGVYPHSKSGKATKLDRVDGLYRLAKFHKLI